MAENKIPEDSLAPQTPVIAKLSIDLSYKIFDPVSVYDENGKIFDAVLREAYLRRAYGKLARSLDVLHPDIDQVFVDFYKLVNVDLTDLTIGDNITYKRVYYRGKDNKLRRANELKPWEYLDYKAETDNLYVPSPTKRYWAIIGDEIKLLPEDISIYREIIALSERTSFMISDNEDISLSSYYFDLLLNIAAAEAMMDLGRTDKYQMYQGAVGTELKLISEGWKTKQIRESDVQ